MRRVKDGQGLSAVTRELGMSTQTLRNWLKASEAGKLGSSGAKVVTPRADGAVVGLRARRLGTSLIRELESQPEAAAFEVLEGEAG